MKRLFYVSSMLALVTSLTLAGKSYAAHQAKSAGALRSVRLCVSAPIGIPSNVHLVQGIYNGAILASTQQKATFKKAGLNLLQPILKDYAKADASGNDPNKERQNALSCIADNAVLGYDGTLNSSIALVSEPILNKAHMVMISPSNTNPVLTDPKSRQAQEPDTAAHKIPWVTYYRVVTTDALQGPADAVVMNKKLKIKSYFLVDDKQTYGAGLAAAMDKYATGKLGMTRVGIGHIDPTDSSTISSTADAVSDEVVSKNADGVFYGGNLETGFTLAKDIRAKGYKKPIMGGDALVDVRWISNAGAGAVNDYATSVGPDIQSAAKSFQTAYKRAFKSYLAGGGFGPYDALSYDAANVMLNAILTAQKAGKLKGSITKQREAVVANVHSAHFSGATGTGSFDSNGDTTNRIVSVYQVVGSSWKFVGTAPNVPGAKPTG
jgi:branched-chain amino acid transport system substrate-binding protein